MIAIDTRIQPFEGQEIEANKNWQNIFLADSQPELIAFLQKCVDQNLIYNANGWTWPDEKYDYDNHDTIRYYSADLEKAGLFVQQLEDMSATFSLKKFWSENKFDLIIEQSLIDVDQENPPAFYVVRPEFSEVWGVKLPSSAVAYSTQNKKINKL